MSIYDQIAANKRKSWFMIVAFIIIIAVLGYLIGLSLDYGYSLFIFAIIFATGSAVISYYYSDKIAISMSGAKEVNKRDEPRLFKKVENLSIGAGVVPMPKVHVIEDPAINAFATGRDPKHSSIAVTRGALQKLDDLELEGVLAHELSHINNYDIRTMAIAVVLVGIIALVGEWFLRSQIWGGRRSRGKAGGAIAVFALVGAILAPIMAQLLKFALSRQREFLADSSAALLTRYPQGLANALAKIASDPTKLKRANSATAHLYISSPLDKVSGRIAGLFSTHPPVEERITRLRGM